MTRDAREIAREIADKAIDARVCCHAYPQCQTDAWRTWTTSLIAAAIERDRAETIERCAAMLLAKLHGHGDLRDSDETRYWNAGLSEAITTLRTETQGR